MATIFDGLDPEWQRGIERSRLFVCLCTPHWLSDPLCQRQAGYAKALGKPVRVLLMHGTTLPPGTFLGVEDLESATVRTPKEAGEQIRRWLEDIP